MKWSYPILFVLIALGLSFPVQQGYLDDIFQKITANTLLFGSTYLLAAFSTLFAGLLMLLVHKGMSHRITILGEDRGKNMLIGTLPIVAFTLTGLDNDFGLDPAWYAFLFASVNTVYAFAEEFGWRRYLQNALEGLNQYFKYVIIAIIWWIWHFRFSTQFDWFVFPWICLVGGFLLGKLADDTRSILPVVAMHNVIILTTNSGNFGRREVFGIALVILGWMLIEWGWKRKNAKKC